MNQLGIFAKYWEPGKVKTRLAKTVGPQLAAEFHRASLTLLLARLQQSADRHCLAVWPPQRLDEFQEIALDWQVQPQSEGDLGEKMRRYFGEAFSQGATRALLVGSDCPLIAPDTIQNAFAALEDHDVVLGPCDDGGYYLVGGRPSMPDLWSDIPWSTADVWPATVRRLESSACHWHAMPSRFDVDQIEDIHRLIAMLPSDDALWTALRDVCQRCVSAS